LHPPPRARRNFFQIKQGEIDDEITTALREFDAPPTSVR
jgi:hypothetical protein